MRTLWVPIMFVALAISLAAVHSAAGVLAQYLALQAKIGLACVERGGSWGGGVCMATLPAEPVQQ